MEISEKMIEMKEKINKISVEIAEETIDFFLGQIRLNDAGMEFPENVALISVSMSNFIVPIVISIAKSFNKHPLTILKSIIEGDTIPTIEKYQEFKGKSDE